VSRGAAAVFRVEEMMDAPVRHVTDAIIDGAIPGGIVAEDGGRADDVGAGVLLPQPGNVE
jgi:hypothetical protein